MLNLERSLLESTAHAILPGHAHSWLHAWLHSGIHARLHARLHSRLAEGVLKRKTVLNFSLNSDSKKRKCMQHYTLNARLKINHHALLSIPDRFLARLSSTEINHNLWFVSMKNLPLVAVRQNRLIRQSWVVAVPSWSVVRVLLFSSHPPSFDSPRPFRVFQFEVTFRGRSIQYN